MEDCDKIKMLLFLIQNVDVFTWSPYEVPGVDPEFIFHKLNMDPSFPPKKQKPRRSTKEHVEAVRLEVRRLKEAGAIREIFFPEWLANTVVVKKKTAFISSNANYHYTVMPFGLKNARATYQQMMTRMFRDKIGCTVKVYIDDMVVKSKQKGRHIKDLQGAFEVLW